MESQISWNVVTDSLRAAAIRSFHSVLSVPESLSPSPPLAPSLPRLRGAEGAWLRGHQCPSSILSREAYLTVTPGASLKRPALGRSTSFGTNAESSYSPQTQLPFPGRVGVLPLRWPLSTSRHSPDSLPHSSGTDSPCWPSPPFRLSLPPSVSYFTTWKPSLLLQTLLRTPPF